MVCNICGEEKPSSQFPTQDNLVGTCRACTEAIENEYQSPSQEELRDQLVNQATSLQRFICVQLTRIRERADDILCHVDSGSDLDAHSNLQLLKDIANKLGRIQ